MPRTPTHAPTVTDDVISSDLTNMTAEDNTSRQTTSIITQMYPVFLSNSYSVICILPNPMDKVNMKQ